MKHIAVGLAFVVLLASRYAAASPLFELVGGVGGNGGIQPRAFPSGSAASYFNPALLVEAQSGLTIGFFALTQQIGVVLDQRPDPSFDVPEGVELGRHADGSAWDAYPLPTRVLEQGRAADDLRPALAPRPRQSAGSGQRTYTYETLGLVAKFFGERLAVGAYAQLPNGDFTNLQASYVDEREQYFSNSLHAELYGDRLTAISIGLGAGLAVTDRLALGIGATFGIHAGVGAPVYVADAGRLEDLLLTLDAKVNVSTAPHFGVSYMPTERLRLTASVHTPQKVEFDATFTFLLANGVAQASGMSFVLDYEPWRAGAGAVYDLFDSKNAMLSVIGSALYGKWSDYVDRHGERPDAEEAWSDTVTAAVGLRHSAGSVASFIDFQYKPTPVAAQIGRTNYVDNDRLGAACGASFAFDAFGTALTLGAQAQAYHLLWRHQWKLPASGAGEASSRVRDEVPDDATIRGEPLEGRAGLQTNNPGFPGYGSSGWVLGGGVSLSAAW